MFIDKARQAHIIHKYPRYVKWASSTYSNDINQVQHIFQYTMPTRFCYGGSLQIINWEKTISEYLSEKVLLPIVKCFYY
jgi:hypothetical protein